MANRFIGGVLTSKPQANTSFSSRASTGTYFDNTGVLRTAPINQPRLNYNFVVSAWTQPSVLIEPETTNIVSYSQDFSQASYWGTNNSTIGSAAGTTPDGTNTAFKIQENTSNNLHGVEQQLGNTNGRAYTLSIFAKAAERSWLIIDNTHQGVANYRNWVNLSTGVTGTMAGSNSHLTMTPVGNGWYRCSVTKPAGTLGSHRICIYASTGDGTITYTGTSGSGILIWGCQLEYQLGMTSYIISPSTGVGTRAADVVGPYSTGIFNLSDRQNTTAVDDQSTVTSFTSTGSTSWTAPADVTSVEVLVVAGGGGANNSAGGNSTGGGGGGGVVYNTSYPVVPGTTYPVVTGAGGAPAASNSVNPLNGSNSQFANLVAIGGGFGAGRDPNTAGGSGGSGGGGNTYGSAGGRNIAGQGYPGGVGVNYSLGVSGGGGGGGGAAGPGGNAALQAGGVNGPGLGLTISGTLVYYGAGGVGQSTGGSNTTAIAGGTASNTNGAANAGAGGAGGTTNNGTSTGGSGVVIIKYKRTPKQLASTSNAAQVVQRFSTTNLWTVPAGVTQVEALVVAGGGAGGYDRGGGGGAGGLSYTSALTVTPGSTYTIGVGAGGIGGTAYRTNNGQSQSGFGSGIGTGTELITNGSAFTTTTGWSATTATLSVPQTGTFRILPNASVNGSASQTITTVIGTIYVVVVKVTSDVSRQFRLFVGSSQFGQQNVSFFTAYTRDSLDNGVSGAGFYSVTFTASATTTWIDLQIGGGTQQATDISYISVRQAILPTIGGGYGGDGAAAASSGGSGGGTGSGAGSSGGSGTAGQGNSGGANGGGTQNGGAGGGGGAGSSGSNGGFGIGSGGTGGTGLPFNITGNLEYYAGGGGGGAAQDFPAPKVSGYGGIGGGGQGGNANTDPGKPGAPNTGGGGGGGSNITQGAGGAGGSGVVILRYRVPQVVTFQDSGSWTCPAGVTSVQALIVAGGGSGSIGGGGGGGGAGGLIYDNSIPVTPGVTYSVVVGQGGAGQAGGPDVNGTAGQNSSFANLIAIGGGQGARNGFAGQNGGSGGGGYGTSAVGSGTYSQGNSGGSGVTDATTYTNGGGGGGAGSSGLAAIATQGGQGGAGLAFTISGTSTFYAGGGAGGCQNAGGTAQVGGVGGGGGNRGAPNSSGYPGTQNTGGGGGGGSYNNGAVTSGSGGSGVVILRWVGA